MSDDWRDVPRFGPPPGVGTATVRPSAYAIVPEDARLAVVCTPQGCFLPGGGMDPGETPEATVVREAREECGLTVRVGAWRRRAVELVYASGAPIHVEKRSTFLDARVEGEPVAPLEADHELRWLAPSDAMVVLTPPSHRWAVGEWSRCRREVDDCCGPRAPDGVQ